MHEVNNDTYEQSGQEILQAKRELEQLPSQHYREMEAAFRKFMAESGIENLGMGNGRN